MHTSCLTCGRIIPTNIGGRCQTCKPKRTRQQGQGREYRTAEWKRTRSLAIATAGAQCTRCGTTEHLQVHHILPLADGGTHDQHNLEVVCRSCHPTVEREHKQSREQ